MGKLGVDELGVREMMSGSISVYGGGYVGLVTAACLARSGHYVQLLDIDERKLAALAEGRVPFFEPGLSEVLVESVSAGRLTFAHPSTAKRPRDFAFVAVGTPSTPTGSADLRQVNAVVDAIIGSPRAGSTVVMKSTVPPGTGGRIASRLASVGMGYVSNPEFLREGSAVEDWYHTDRIVLGGEHEDTGKVAGLYADIDAPVVLCDIASAELVKYASNAFLATKISFVNEIAGLCEITGADIGTVANAIGMDRRIGSSFLNAGIGYGGSCFPKDTRALDFLSRVNGFDFHLLRAVIEVNSCQHVRPVIWLRKRLGGLEDRQIAVLGLSFKPNTDDVRESPSTEIIELLLADGASVRAHDPVARLDLRHPAYLQAESLEEAVRGAHGAIIATEWPEYRDADWPSLAQTMAGEALIFDGRNCLDPEGIRECGLVYHGVGRP